MTFTIRIAEARIHRGRSQSEAELRGWEEWVFHQVDTSHWVPIYLSTPYMCPFDGRHFGRSERVQGESYVASHGASRTGRTDGKDRVDRDPRA